MDGAVIKEAVVIAKEKGVRSAPTSIQQDNISLAFTIVITKYRMLKADSAALQTWNEAALLYQNSLHRYVNSYQLFIAYFMTKYTATLGTFDVHWISPAEPLPQLG